jgi:lactoylglutathione lyase
MLVPPARSREFTIDLQICDGRVCAPYALAFYRDALGLPVIEAWEQPTGSGAVLDAGRATLELLSLDQAELVDEVEVGARVAGPVRLALEAQDSTATAETLVPGGAEQLADPVVTPS